MNEIIEEPIRARGIRKSFGSLEVLKGVDLILPRVKCYAFWGHRDPAKAHCSDALTISSDLTQDWFW